MTATMTGHPNVMCVVPARSGSERIRDKNLSEIGGVPLLVRAVHVALEAFGRVFVSTDSADYAEIACSAGATVPSLRPSEISGSLTPMDEVVRHVVCEWCADERFFVLVQATAPFLEPRHLHGVVDLLERHPELALIFHRG
jgi:N-acylneuraminate cytidylyltransferase